MAKNVIIGQSGGPTAVINSSLAGVYKAAISLGAEKVYGMQYGIEGLLKEEMLELNVLLNDRMSIELLKRTPSSYLGSCRYKLPDPDVDAAPFVKLFTLFDKYDICALFYIGGNDSMDTIAKLSRYGARVGSPVVLAVSTNDGLGASGENMARLCQRKHYYFVPYGQDDPFAKPQSLKADLALLPAAVDAALRGEQLQPVLLGQRNV
jgi:hypothetical protein